MVSPRRTIPADGARPAPPPARPWGANARRQGDGAWAGALAGGRARTTRSTAERRGPRARAWAASRGAAVDSPHRRGGRGESGGGRESVGPTPSGTYVEKGRATHAGGCR